MSEEKEQDVMTEASECLSSLYEKCGIANELAVVEAEKRRLWRSYVDAYFRAQGLGKPQEG